jgi:hypothetical protein
MFHNIDRLYRFSFYSPKIWDIDQILFDNRSLINNLSQDAKIEGEPLLDLIEKAKILNKKINHYKIMYDRDYCMAFMGRTDKELNSLMKEFGVRKRRKITKDISKKDFLKKRETFSKISLEYFDNCSKLVNFLADKFNENQ